MLYKLEAVQIKGLLIKGFLIKGLLIRGLVPWVIYKSWSFRTSTVEVFNPRKNKASDWRLCIDLEWPLALEKYSGL